MKLYGKNFVKTYIRNWKDREDPKKGTEQIKRKMYISLLIPYIIIGIIGTIFLVFMYYSAYRGRVSEIKKGSEVILERIDRNLENCISDAERISVEISTNARLNALWGIQSAADHETSYRVAMAVRELSKIRNYNYLLHETVVYYESLDLMITGRSIRTFDMFWGDYGIKPINMEHGKEILTAEYIEGEMVSVEEELFYVKTIDYIEKGCRVNTITKFNTQKLKENILDYGTRDGEILIVSQKAASEPLITTGDLQDGKAWDYLSDKGYFKAEWTGAKTQLTSTWIMDRDIINQRLSITRWSYLGIGGCFIILVFIGLQSVRNNYKEIEALMQKLSVLYKHKSKHKANTEIGYMQNAVSYLEDIIRRQGVVVTEDTIKKAIYGMVAEDDEIYEWLTKEKQLFIGGFSALALLSNSNQENGENGDARFNLFIINNVVKELFERFSYCGVIVTNQYYIVVLNWEDDDDMTMDWILDQFESVRKFICQKFGVSYSVSVSTPKDSVLKLNEAYKEALIALAERQILGTGKVIYYGNLSERKTRHTVDEKTKEKLINNIKVGCGEEVESLLKEIYQKNYVDDKLTIEWGKILFLEMTQMLLELSEESGIAILLSAEELFAPSYTSDLYIEKIMTAAWTLCQANQSGKTDINHRLEEIKRFIETQYGDVDMSVAMLAEHFHMNMSYLSRTFKAQTGENLLMYIMIYRVEKAKELLKATKNSVLVVAEKTGFANAASFNRVFKKITGITPGKYRKLQSKSSKN